MTHSKQALTTAPVLAYPDYTKPFILETDASLKGLGTVLSQKGNDGEIRVIAYASRSLRPSERSMRDYSSAKIELLALKWSVCEKFKDYLLGSKFTVFTDNNPLMSTSRPVSWALLKFDGSASWLYTTSTSCTGQGIVTLLPMHSVVGQKARGKFVTKSVATTRMRNGKPFPMLPYVKETEGLVGGVKVGRALRERIQVVQSAEDDVYGSHKIEVVTGMVDVFHQVPSTTMAEHQAKDNQLAPVLEWVREGKQPTKAAIYQVRSRNTRQLMYQYHRLHFKRKGSYIDFTFTTM